MESKQGEAAKLALIHTLGCGIQTQSTLAQTTMALVMSITFDANHYHGPNYGEMIQAKKTLLRASSVGSVGLGHRTLATPLNIPSTSHSPGIITDFGAQGVFSQPPSSESAPQQLRDHQKINMLKNRFYPNESMPPVLAQVRGW